MPPAPGIDFRDILDPSAFVHGTINKWCRPTASRGPIVLSGDEREELHAEGMAILCKLAIDFEPHRDGYEHAGRFSGYAAMYLPRKLGDAWHRMHPEHLLVTQPGGGRRWEYRERAVSLQALTAEDGEDRERALISREEPARPSETIESLLREQLEERLNNAVRVAGLFSEGMTSEREVAQCLGMTSAQVREARTDLEAVAQRLRTLSQR